MDTTQAFQNAYNYAKTNPNTEYATGLRKRIEAGQYDKEIIKLGIKLPGYTPRIGYSDIGADIKQIGTGIVETVKDRAGNIKESIGAFRAGEQTLGETIGQTAGQVAGGISGVAGEVLTGGIKAALPQEAETAIKQGIQKGVQGAMELTSRYEDLKANKPVLAGAINIALGNAPEAAVSVKDMIEGYQRIKETNPRLARNLDAALGIAEFALDIGTLGGAKVVTQAGKEVVEQGAKAVGREIAQAGAKAVTMADEVATQVGKATSGVRKIASDIVPTKSEFMSGQISKALDLTQGDLSNIKLATGNDVGDFIARNNLIGGSKDETIKAVKQLTDSQYKLVRDEIGKVKNVYSINDIPKVKQSLSLLEKQLKDVPGLEDTYKQVKGLAKKTTIELKDVQKVKELLDEQFSLFKATGDVKEGTIKKGLANVRKNIKEFIETEVKNNTGADIAQLNNDVSTGKSIMNLANKRATREFTRANVSLSDLGTFGGASVVGTPLVGMAAVAVKRIIETPTVRLQIAKLINSLPKATQKAVQNELLDGKIPDVIEKAMKDYRLATKIKKNSPSSTKNASIPKASTKSATKSNDLYTDLVNEAKKYKSVETPLIKFAKKYKSISGLESDLPRFDSLSDLAKNVRALNLNKFPRLKGEDIITVYRGAHPNSRSITAGDWITLDKSTARNYSSNVQELKVKKSDIVNPGIQSDEYIFAPKSIESNTETLLKKANKK